METEKSMRNERWAVVTGASSGIGFAIARRLAMRGYNIFAAAKDVERLDECARKLSGECGIRVRTYAADLALPDAAECLFAACQEAGIRAEVLVNDAGVFIYNDIIETDQKRIDGIICLHIRTVTALCRLFAEEMAAAGGGYILNMASYSMWMPLPGIALYSATKAYVKTFSVAFAQGSPRTQRMGYGRLPRRSSHGFLRPEPPAAESGPCHRGAHDAGQGGPQGAPSPLQTSETPHSGLVQPSLHPDVQVHAGSLRPSGAQQDRMLPAVIFGMKISRTGQP